MDGTDDATGPSAPTASPHAPVREDWLALHAEAVRDPGRPIVDAHHHLWDRPAGRYLLPELRRDVESGHDVVATVYVQARSMYRSDGPAAFRSVGEVEFARDTAAAAEAAGMRCRACAGIVAHADLMLGDDVEPVLDALATAGGARLKGIRNATAWHPDPAIVSNPQPPPAGLLSTAAFRRGAARLAPRGLVLDVWAYHTQLDEVLGLARALPDLTIVLDHAGGPLGAGPYAGRADEVRTAWRAALEELARCPNLHVKLGGLAMRVGGFDFDRLARPPSSERLADAWSAILRTAIDLFGPARCLFESNFPVDKGMVAYVPLWNAFKRVAASYGETEQAAMFGGTANRVYDLGLPHFAG